MRPSKGSRDFPGGLDDKESACNSGDLGSILGSGRRPGRRKWLPIPVFLPGKSYGQRSQATVHGVSESEGAENTEVTQRAGPSCPQILEGSGQVELFCM